MQARVPGPPSRGDAPRPFPRAALLAALAMVVGSTIVAVGARMSEHLSAIPALAKIAQGRITLDQVSHLEAEGAALRAEIDALAEQLAAVGSANCTTRPRAFLTCARHATRTTLDLILGVKTAVRQGEDFLARHLRREVHSEYRAARSYLNLARRVLPGR